MRVRWRVALVAVLALACRRDDPAATPEATFDRLRLAVATRDARALYEALDRDSRWAIDTVWQYQREMAATARTMLPEVQARVLPRVELAEVCATPAELLVRQTRFGDPFERLGGAQGLGPRVELVTDAPGQVRVRTAEGLVVPLAVDPEGRWGWSGLRAELTDWRHAVANDHGRLADDARRLAPGE